MRLPFCRCLVCHLPANPIPVPPTGHSRAGFTRRARETTVGYKIVAESDKASLNSLGAEGWKLIAVTNGGAEEVYYSSERSKFCDNRFV